MESENEQKSSIIQASARYKKVYAIVRNDMARKIRNYLHNQSASYAIPPKVNTQQLWPFDKET